ncbi:MAG: hypothetical protein AAFY08_11545 [Planctomycetota bacterium]
MQFNTPARTTAAPRPARRATRRQRGSVLLLVVVSIVLMTVMGATYLQVARVDRFSTEQIEFESGDIDAVVAASLRQVRTALKDDVLEIDPSGDAWFLSRNDEDGDGLLDESYDYAWTNLTTPGSLDDMWLAFTTPRFHEDDPSGTGPGGAYGSPVAPLWPHLTNLLDPTTMGTGDEQFIRLPRSQSDPDYPGDGSQSSPQTYGGGTIADLAINEEIFASGTNQLSEDATSNTWERVGADADRDGVPDARWMYAPVRRIGTTEYVMAARIIDNSSLLNLNAASWLTGGDADPFAFDASSGDNERRPRGYLPSDFDLARLASRAIDNSGGSLAGATSPVAYGGSVVNELTAWMGRRGVNFVNVGGTDLYELGVRDNTITDPPEIDPRDLPGGLDPLSPTAFSSDSRLGLYLNNGSGATDYGSTASKYGPADEIELRWGNGINGSGVTATVEDDLITLTRNDNSSGSPSLDNRFINDTDPIAPGDYRAAEVAEEATGTTSAQDALAEYFQGGLDSVTYANREFPAIRHLLTTYNGVDTLIPNVDGQSQSSTTANDPETKFSLLFGEYDWNANSYNDADRRDELFDLIADVFSLPNDTSSEAYLNATGPTQLGETQSSAALLTSAILDYVDADSTPGGMLVTFTGGIDRTFYGLERLPFLREIYLQVGYKHRDELDDTGAAGSDMFYDTWEIKPDSAAIAVEFGNPFDRRITFDRSVTDPTDADVRVRVTQGGTQSFVYRLADAQADTGTAIVLEPVTNTQLIDLNATGETDSDQWVLYTNPDDSGDPELPINESGVGENLLSALGNGTDFNGTSGTEVATAAGSPPFTATGGAVVVELQVDTADNGWVTYDRLSIDASDVSDIFDPDGTSPAGTLVNPAAQNDFVAAATSPGTVLPATPFDSYAMLAVARDGRGIRYMTNYNSSGPGTSLNWLTALREGNNPSTTSSFLYNDIDTAGTSLTELGTDQKTNGNTDIDTATSLALGANFESEFSPFIADRALLSVSEIASIYMLGFHRTDDGTNITHDTIAERLTAEIAGGTTLVTENATSDAVTGYPEWHRQAYLDISPDAVVVDLDTSSPTTTEGVPHAALLFDRLTILDPGNDDRDNDDDGDSDESPSQVTDIEERLVPGLMNINMAPSFLAALAAPLPEHLDDAEGLFRGIAAYRDYPADARGDSTTKTRGYPVGMARQEPGIASIGELLFLNDATAAAISPTTGNLAEPSKMQAVGRDTSTSDYGSLSSADDRYDIIPMPEVERYISTTLGDPFERRTMTDGPEERLARFQFLANLFSTRSDVYTAYVVIRGYQSGAYQLGPTEQAHYIAVFDRSGLRDANTPVRLVAFERVQ